MTRARIPCAPLVAAAAGLLVATAASCTTPPPPDDDYRASVETWRAERVERLRSETGWLTVVGLEWLEPGENRFGTGDGNAVTLPEGGGPASGGALILEEDGAVRLEPAEDGGLLVNDEPAAPMQLATDADGRPDVVRSGDLRFHVIRRGDRTGVRMKHPDATARTEFRGLEHFDIDPRYRVEAEFVPYDPPREATIATVIGVDQTMTVPGYLRFRLNGNELTLEPLVDDLADEQYFIMFRDGTSGKETYGPGRFLSSDRERDGRVVLDFNKAYNPPCAFTPYATCPLPPRSNWLDAPVMAGEKAYGDHTDGVE